MDGLQLRQKYVSTLAAYVGKAAEGGANHKKIIDTYNSVLPHPRGYAMTYDAPWCAPTVSAIAIMCGMLDIFAFECSCTKQIEQWQAMGRWIENDAYVPQPGDVVYYCWSDSGAGDCTKAPDHVGVVESVKGNVITVIEGNKNNNVERRKIGVNGRYIRGFAWPDYASLAAKEEKEMAEPIYKDINDVPESWRPNVNKLLETGTINGGTPDDVNPTDVNLTKTEAKLCHVFVKYVDKVVGDLGDALTEKVVEGLVKRLTGKNANKE